MKDYSYLAQKRVEVLEHIKPICDGFGINDYDYEVDLEKGHEYLRVNNTKIGCSCNSLLSVRDELIGYIFINTWCRDRHLGAFSTQTKNVIKRYWIKQEVKN